jgi:hypothetical protein
VTRFSSYSPLSSTLLLTAFTCAMAAAVACGGPDEDPDTYNIVFALGSSPDPLSTLEFRVDYDGGEIGGNGALAACELVQTEDEQTVVLSDNDDGRLTVEIEAIEDPLVVQDAILECDFVSSNQPTADNFDITILAATDEDDNGISNLSGIDVVVTSTELLSSASVVAGPIE